MKKQRPDLKNLENLVTPTYACCWKEIGVQLNIPTGILNSIEMGFPTNPTWCCNKMWMHWDEIDIEASWDRVIKAIDSPAVSAVLRSFTTDSVTRLVVNETLKAVSHLSCRLKVISIKNRYKAEDDDWPLTSPKHFTSVALIHHKGRQTEREVLAVATLQNKGDIDLRKIHSDDASAHVQYLKQSKCTKSISDIFAKVEGTNNSPSAILIEGVPGIGKTVLSKEIVFQWANGELLPNITLMFLIYLRDTESHKITSLESFVNYVSYPKVAKHVLKYITDNEGKNIMIIFDGYDELSEKLRKHSFLYKMMNQKLTEIPFCNVVITSRPNASAHLHNKVDLRVEILGFTNEDRKAYIVDALKHDDNKIEKVMKYLNNNPAINAYCYIPLNMTILLSFFENSDTDVTELPNTQTGINEKFICTTISRYIRKLKELVLNFSTFSEVRGPCDDHEIGTPCVGHEKGVPYGTIFKEISKLAFKALEKDKIVFTTVELQETCPCLESQSENWNGLGLLKPVQLFTVENNLRNVSFNFLHFTVQEILAAYHITLMSEGGQLKCMEQTFWDNRYYNTWIMYVGLTKNQMPITFKHFLSGNWFLLLTHFLNWWNNGTYFHIKSQIINDKIKCLHLFQCFSEAENKDLCQCVGQLLQENEIDLSGQTLSAVNILTISLFLTRSTTKYWNILNLSECFIGDDGIKQLHNSFTSNNRSKVCIDILNLSHNNLTQSSVEFIAGLILEWNVKDIMFNEINQNDLNEEVMHLVMQFPIEQNNFITCNFNESEVVFARLSHLDYLILNFSSTSGKGSIVRRIKNIFTDLQANNNFNTGKLQIIFRALKNCTAISHLNLGADISQLEIVDMVTLIANNKFMEYLYLPKMQNSNLNQKVKLMTIIDVLKSNRSLKYVDMSLITIDNDLISDIAVIINNNSKLKEIKVFKLLLIHNDIQHLGNYLVKITGLKSLNITGYIFNRQDADKLVIAIKQNFEIWQLNLSNCKVPIYHLLDILSYKSIMKNLNWLDLSSCYLDSKEMRHTLDVLKNMKYLQHINLSANTMKSNAISEMAAMIKSNKDIQVLCLPNCVLDQKDLRIIIQAMQTISSLQYVDFNTSQVNNKLANDIATLFANNSELKQLRFARVVLKHSGFQELKACLFKLRGVKHLSITDCNITNHDVALLETFIYRNHSIQKIMILNCKTIDNKVAATVRDHVGVFDQLEILDLSNSNFINDCVVELLVFLSCSSKLKQVILCNCQLQSNETEQLLMILKYMRHLECVDLYGNNMDNDSVVDMEAMIVNNKQLQKLCLPNCVLDQTSLRIIIQAMQSLSSLQYVDFSTNEIDNELANDLSLFSKLRNIYSQKLALNASGFHHIKNCLYNILKGLRILTITGCNFARQDAAKVVTIIRNNSEIQKLNLSSCKINVDQLLTIFSCTIQLKWLDLSNCQLYSEEMKQLFSIIKQMKNLRCVNLSANTMADNVSNDIAKMIINNKDIQELYLPDCVLTQTSLRIIIQAMQAVSSLQYVDFSMNKIDHELANDVAIFCANNTKLEKMMFTELKLCHNGFNHIKTFVMKIYGIKSFSIIECGFTDQDATNMAIFFTQNTKIQELSLSNCNILCNMCILKQLKVTSSLQCLKLDNITMIEDEVIAIINNNSNLVHLEMTRCNMSERLYVKLMRCAQLKNILKLNFSSNSVFSKEIKQFVTLISSHAKLKSLSLSKCQLRSNEINQIFNALKKMRYLQCVDLSGNTMTHDIANDIADVIINNKDIQELYLPDCVLASTSFRIIIQAMQTVSSLQYVDFSTNKIDNELANAVTVLVTNNKGLKKIKTSQLILNKIFFRHINKYLEIIEGLKLLNISFCSFTRQDAAKLVTVISNNSEIQQLSLSNCTIPINELLSIISCNTKLKCLDVSNCNLHSKKIKKIFSVLKKMRYLQCVNLSANTMADNVVNDIADMIINNKNIQELYLPDCVLTQASLRIIIQAMQIVSSLQCVDFNKNKIDNELAIDIAALFIVNPQLEQLNFGKIVIKQNGFQHLKTHFIKLKELKHLSITDCSFTNQDMILLETCICSNHNIQEVIISNCKITDHKVIITEGHMHIDSNGIAECLNLSGRSGFHLSVNTLSIFICLKKVILSNCHLQSNETRELLMILKYMRHLECVDLYGNNMDNDSVSDMEAMIVNNKQLQRLCLPNCILNQASLRIICQALQSLSSLQYVDFSTNRIEQDNFLNLKSHRITIVQEPS